MQKIEVSKNIYLTNNMFDRTFFLSLSCKIFKNMMILMNDSLFSREKDSPHLDGIKLLKKNSLHSLMIYRQKFMTSSTIICP